MINTLQQLMSLAIFPVEGQSKPSTKAQDPKLPMCACFTFQRCSYLCKMQRAPKCVVVLSGLPGSGKTTLATKLLSHVESLGGHQARAVCFDEFVSPANIKHEQSATAVAAFSPASWKVRLKLDRVM